MYIIMCSTANTYMLMSAKSRMILMMHIMKLNIFIVYII